MLLYSILAVLAASHISSQPTGTCIALNEGVTDCGSGDFLKVREFKMHGTPAIGKTLNVTLAGELLKELDTGVKLSIYTKIFSFPVPILNEDICELAAQTEAKYQCPLSPQNISLDYTLFIDNAVPKGDYDVYAVGRSSTKAELFKVKVHVKL